MKQPPDYTFVKAGMINFTRYLANYFGKHASQYVTGTSLMVDGGFTTL